MALSDYERQMLEELEVQLADEDPSFAKTMKPAAMSVAAGRQVSLRNIVIGRIVAVVGITILVVSIALPFIPLGVLGVVIMGIGFWYAGSSAPSKTPQSSRSADGQAANAKASSFMERQAERWQKRQGS